MEVGESALEFLMPLLLYTVDGQVSSNAGFTATIAVGAYIADDFQSRG